MTILALDIDDCIFLNRNNWVAAMEDNFEMLEINLKRLQKILDFYDAKIFITSAWSSILKLEDSNIIYDNPAYGLPGKSYYDEEFKAGAVRLIVEQKRPAARVAKELGVTAETLRTWVKNYTSPPESEYMQLKAAQAEVKRLKRQNADHLETIEILKKAPEKNQAHLT